MKKKQLSAIITFSVITVIMFSGFIFRKTDCSHFTNKCDKIALSILFEHKINTQAPLRTTHHRVSTLLTEAQSIKREFLLPQNQSLAEIKSAFLKNTDFAPVQLSKIQKKQTKKEHILIMDFFYKNLHLYHLILRQKIALADIALVIDDWGYNNKVLPKSFELGVPLTYAVLPCLPYSKRTAKKASEKGHEVILHLPLEPHNAEKYSLEKNTIFTSMNKADIENIIKNDMASIPNLKGINNHMGSKATESEYVLSILFDQIKQNNIYFLDSYTSNDSLAPEVAARKGITFMRRDIFIDNVSDKDSIKSQMLQAKNIAAEKGYAIAIGHAKDLTIDTLRKIIPEFKKEGFRFVYLSDILKKIKHSTRK